MRLEDIDQGRCRPEYAEAIQDDLRWLGLDWDGPVRLQSEHLQEYQTTLDSLRQRGLVYPCFCNRADIAASAAAAHGPDGTPVYPGTCRGMGFAAKMAEGQRYALRLNIQAAMAGDLWYDEDGALTRCHPDRFGDIVLARKDAPASYHLCATHDDAVQGVTLVTRGEDLKPATDVQRLLQTLMGWSAPRYAHHRLLVDESGRRLAKRDKALTLRALRADGVSPAEVLRRIGQFR